MADSDAAAAAAAAAAGAAPPAAAAAAAAAASAAPPVTAAAADLGTDEAWEGSVEEGAEVVAASQFRHWRDEGGEALGFSEVGLRGFPAGFWEQAQGVKQLIVFYNELKVIPAGLGCLGESLRMLDCSYNEDLCAVPSEALAALTGLEDLNLAGTALTSLPDELFAITSLYSLNVRNCSKLGAAGPADGLFPRVSRLTNLTQLDLANFGISGELDSSVGNLVKLVHLDLSGNPNLTGLPESVLGKLVNLDILSLGSCEKVTSLPPSLGLLTRLRILHCSGCGVETLPPQVGDCLALEILNVDDCASLTHLPPSLSRCTALKSVSVRDSGVQSPPPSLVTISERIGNITPILDYLRERDGGRFTKGATGAGAGGAQQ